MKTVLLSLLALMQTPSASNCAAKLRASGIESILPKHQYMSFMQRVLVEEDSGMDLCRVYWNWMHSRFERYRYTDSDKHLIHEPIAFVDYELTPVEDMISHASMHGRKPSSFVRKGYEYEAYDVRWSNRFHLLGSYWSRSRHARTLVELLDRLCDERKE